MFSLIRISEGPVDIHELRARYLGKLKTEEGVMLPTFLFRDREYFITNFTPAPNDSWLLTLSNAEGAITRLTVKNGDLMSNGSVLFLAEERKTYSAKEYYDYWAAREGKPAPFFYESRQYHVKSFMRVPGSTDLWITAERETGHWYTFRMSDNQKSKFTRHTMTNGKGHQSYDWVLENVEWAADTIRYF